MKKGTLRNTTVVVFQGSGQQHGGRLPRNFVLQRKDKNSRKTPVCVQKRRRELTGRKKHSGDKKNW